jgi:hypothetical protein
MASWKDGFLEDTE